MKIHVLIERGGGRRENAVVAECQVLRGWDTRRSGFLGGLGWRDSVDDGNRSHDVLKPRVCPVVPMRRLCGVPANKTHAKCVRQEWCSATGFPT